MSSYFESDEAEGWPHWPGICWSSSPVLLWWDVSKYKRDVNTTVFMVYVLMHNSVEERGTHPSEKWKYIHFFFAFPLTFV